MYHACIMCARLVYTIFIRLAKYMHNIGHLLLPRACLLMSELVCKINNGVCLIYA